ncbi:Na(+)/H(+) antiporter [hydrothermal vent metagenome]|uniref:Na(+)/H(+) antiporter n=1 Tax=hydrothermal vent metagenome TaxID=652676 RepID=A0A1W1C1U6_9ZZZZ
MQILLIIGLIFVLGSFMKVFVQNLGILNVVGYLILGVIIGPSGFNLVPKEFIQGSSFIIDMSLSLISVLVGANLRYDILKDMLRQIFTISFFEAIFTFLFISISFYTLFDLLNFSFNHEYRIIAAILFGGLATATAPATILAVSHEIKAKGKFNSFLLGIVAMDNAFALIFFSFIVIISKTFIDASSIDAHMFLSIIKNVVFSVIVGIAGAFISEIIDRVFKKNQGVKTTSTLGMIFITFSVSQYFSLEPLLASLVMGIVASNLSKNFFLVKKEFDNHLKDIIFLLFFTISAMHLNISFLTQMPLAIIAYVAFRIIGKIVGVWIGSKLSNADDNIGKHLGIALFPQAGIAIGLALSLQDMTDFETIAPIILNIIIATTLIHELIGPFLTKLILLKYSKYTKNR